MRIDQAAAAAALQARLLTLMKGQEAAPAPGFKPEVAVPAEAPLLDQVIGMSGRDPAWTPDAPR